MTAFCWHPEGPLIAHIALYLPETLVCHKHMSKMSVCTQAGLSCLSWQPLSVSHPSWSLPSPSNTRVFCIGTEKSVHKRAIWCVPKQGRSHLCRLGVPLPSDLTTLTFQSKGSSGLTCGLDRTKSGKTENRWVQWGRMSR